VGSKKFIPKIILFDIETLPNWFEILRVWPRLSAYPGLTLKATITTIICAGWKVFGEKKVHCINAWDFSRWKRNINDDYTVVKKISKILSTADAVVTHNGKSFDWRFLQTRLAYHKLPLLTNLHHIDTKEVAKKHFFAFNNKLETIGRLLANDKKLENGGWDLWVKVAGNNARAKKLMSDYCKQDVLLLEKCYKEMRPLISNIPNHNLFINDGLIDKESRVCPNCGGSRLYAHGLRITKTTKYRRYRCRDCRSFCRTDKKDAKPRSI